MRNYPKHSQIQDTLGGSAARDLTQAACGHGAYGPEIFMILGQTPPFSSNDEVTAIIAIRRHMENPPFESMYVLLSPWGLSNQKRL